MDGINVDINSLSTTMYSYFLPYQDLMKLESVGIEIPWPVVFLDRQEPSEMIPEDSRPPLPSYFTFSDRLIFTMTEQGSNYWLFLSVFIPHK